MNEQGNTRWIPARLTRHMRRSGLRIQDVERIECHAVMVDTHEQYWKTVRPNGDIDWMVYLKGEKAAHYIGRFRITYP